MYSDKEKESNVSFNMSLATLERIHNLLKILESGQGLLIVRHATLNLYKELYPFINEVERAEGNAMYNTIYKDFIQDAKDHKLCHFPRGYEQTLDTFDFWIRDKFHEKGLLMAKSDNPHNALGGN